VTSGYKIYKNLMIINGLTQTNESVIVTY